MRVRVHLFWLALCFLFLVLWQAPFSEAGEEIGRGNNQAAIAEGLLMLDYEVVSVPRHKPIDLFGIHYLKQLHDWFYLGLGVKAPLVYGNYGGFMAVNMTTHTQYNLFDSVFLDAGLSIGGGGGGSSITQSIELSGTGGFFKGYLGLGYHFDDFSLGVNYSHFRFVDALINQNQFNAFIQKPVSYMTAPYTSDHLLSMDDDSFQVPNSIFTLELNNIFQIQPTGRKKSNIGTIAPQMSYLFTDHGYLFFGIDVGYHGIPLYNQITGGLGYKAEVSSRVHVYGQMGAGSGGYSPDDIETGAGLLLYPKLSLEYMVTRHVGLSLTGGYLFAPTGTSKNLTLGATINYHLAADSKAFGVSDEKKTTLNKFRFDMFHQTAFKVGIGGKKHKNFQLLSFQFNHVLSDNWYLPTQVSVAYTDFLGYPGYGEMLVGLGWQSHIFQADDIQYFAQVLTGANVHGVLLKPAIGLNLGKNEDFALYTQLGTTISIDRLYRKPEQYHLNANFFGLGLTYRFSLPALD